MPHSYLTYRPQKSITELETRLKLDTLTHTPDTTAASTPGCNPACRACHYKDLNYTSQLDRKNRWASAKLGRWLAVLKPILPAPEPERFGYRSKSWLRTREGNHLDADGASSQACNASQSNAPATGPALGLEFGMTRAIRIGMKWEQEFISWETCPLHHPAINQTLANIKRQLPFSQQQLIGEQLAGIWFGSPHIVLVAKDGSVFDHFREISWANTFSPPFTHVWGHINSQVGRKVFSHRELIPLSNLKSATDLSPPPVRAFRQVATTLLRQARAQALDWLLLRDPAPKLLLDLYSGSGDLAQSLPNSLGWLGIELSRHAAEFANTLRVHNDAVVHRSFVGTVEDRLADPNVQSLLRSPLALYINPPRTGLHPSAFERIAGILASHPETPISYLSCSASSLARDLELFESIGYRPKNLQPFDFFPHTEHFEILAELE